MKTMVCVQQRCVAGAAAGVRSQPSRRPLRFGRAALPASSRMSSQASPVSVRSQGEAGQAAAGRQRQQCGCGECDGEGRIIGGMGAVPGFGWWPIKAYRPCPNFTKTGQTYKR